MLHRARRQKLISADYSQIELRVLAHLSRDEALLAAFREGADIHARTASLLFDARRPRSPGSAPQRQDHQLRADLRHGPAEAGARAQDPAVRGQGVHGPLF
ncbi:MAG: DNA polymerase [Bilophila wadsworthia]